MSFCDLLFSADLCVPNVQSSLSQLIERIGLPQPGPNAYVEYTESGSDCVFALVNKSFRLAPTRLEIIGPKTYPGKPAPSYGQRIFDMQEPRPCKTHATVVAVPAMDAVVERVRRLGIRHWLDEDQSVVPFNRLWMGVTETERTIYRPDADGGMMFEVIPSNSPAFPPALFTGPPPQPKPDAARSEMVRILSRAYLVKKIDDTLKTLERVFGWETAGPVIAEPELGYRTVLMSANHAQGASLRLVEATDPDLPDGKYFAKHGPGPYAIHIAVIDLEAKAEDLKQRGTSFAHRRAGRHEPARLAPDPAFTADTPFEFVTAG